MRRLTPKSNLIVGKYYPELDGLRGFAVLMVIFFHAFKLAYDKGGEVLTGISHYYALVSDFCTTGVDLFFVLSGFLITGIIIDTKDNANHLKSFYIRRALRIFPLYYALVFLVLGALILFSNKDHDIINILMYFVYLQNWYDTWGTGLFSYMNHTWTLAVEEQFYIIWPILFMYFYKRSTSQSIYLCLVMILIAWSSRIIFINMEQYNLLHTSTLSRVDSLCMGALFSICCAHNKEYMKRYIGVFRNIICATIPVIILCVILGQQHDLHNIMVHVRTFLCTIFYGSLLAYVFLINDKFLLKKFFSLFILRKIGRISYGLYVFHIPIMLIIWEVISVYEFTFYINNLILLFGGGLISFIVAYLSYRYFESPILKLKDKYAPLSH